MAGYHAHSPAWHHPYQLSCPASIATERPCRYYLFARVRCNPNNITASILTCHCVLLPRTLSASCKTEYREIRNNQHLNFRYSSALFHYWHNLGSGANMRRIGLLNSKCFAFLCALPLQSTCKSAVEHLVDYRYRVTCTTTEVAEWLRRKKRARKRRRVKVLL